MRLIPAFLTVALLPGLAAFADEEPHVVRILELKDMGTQDAITVLRSQIQVRQIAEIRDMDLVVVAGTVERIDRAESLLRELDSLAEARDPHDPWTPDRSNEGPIDTRIFRIDGLERKAAITVMRAIYQVRHLSENPKRDEEIIVTEPIAKLDRIEALFGSLGALDTSGG